MTTLEKVRCILFLAIMGSIPAFVSSWVITTALTVWLGGCLMIWGFQRTFDQNRVAELTGPARGMLFVFFFLWILTVILELVVGLTLDFVRNDLRPPALHAFLPVAFAGLSWVLAMPVLGGVLAQKAVLLALREMGGGRKKVGLEDIEKRTCLNRRQVKAAVRRLAAKRLVMMIGCADPKGNGVWAVRNYCQILPDGRLLAVNWAAEENWARPPPRSA